jgi:hypothetical protein
MAGMHIDWNSTTMLAAYGAVVATVTFGWNLVRDLRDRGELKVSASVRRLVRSPAGGYAIAPDLSVEGASEELYIVLTVANTGRRPMRWEGWGVKRHTPVNGKLAFICIPRHLPKILAEKEIHQEYTVLDQQYDPDNIKKLYIWDGINGEWKLSWFQLRKLNKEIKRWLAPVDDISLA